MNIIKLINKNINVLKDKQIGLKILEFYIFNDDFFQMLYIESNLIITKINYGKLSRFICFFNTKLLYLYLF